MNLLLTDYCLDKDFGKPIKNVYSLFGDYAKKVTAGDAIDFDRKHHTAVFKIMLQGRKAPIPVVVAKISAAHAEVPELVFERDVSNKIGYT